jgi:chemotaxis protein MotB
VKLVASKNWVVFVQGHASRGEVSSDGTKDAFTLSSARAEAVTRSLVLRGIRPDRITTTFYGDTRPDNLTGNVQGQDQVRNRRVDFIIRKSDLYEQGRKVQSR